MYPATFKWAAESPYARCVWFVEGDAELIGNNWANLVLTHAAPGVASTADHDLVAPWFAPRIAGPGIPCGPACRAAAASPAAAAASPLVPQGYGSWVSRVSQRLAAAVVRAMGGGTHLKTLVPAPCRTLAGCASGIMLSAFLPHTGHEIFRWRPAVKDSELGAAVAASNGSATFLVHPPGGRLPPMPRAPSMSRRTPPPSPAPSPLSVRRGCIKWVSARPTGWFPASADPPPASMTAPLPPASAFRLRLVSKPSRPQGRLLTVVSVRCSVSLATPRRPFISRHVRCWISLANDFLPASCCATVISLPQCLLQSFRVLPPPSHLPPASPPRQVPLLLLRQAITPGRQDAYTAHSTGIPHQHVNRAELMAILWGILHSPPNTLVALISDNIAAIAWARKGHAPSMDGDAIITTIQTCLSLRRSRLCIAHVPGKHNPSDIFTRELFQTDGRFSGGRIFPKTSEWKVTSWM